MTMLARIHGRWVSALALGLAAGCAEMPEDQAFSVGEEQRSIVGGASTAAGQYPATGMLLKGRRYRCTATLIKPDVAITAAHCLQDNGASFGEYAFSLDRDLSDLVADDPIPVLVYHQHPQYIHEDKPTDVGRVNDVGVIILERPVEDVPVERLHMANVPAFLEIGAELDLCGYGMATWYERSTAGIQRSAHVFVDHLADWEMRLTHDDPQPCNGDSGAPLFVENESGRWIAAIVVRAVGETHLCDNGAVATRIAPYALWIEKASLDRDPGCSVGAGAGPSGAAPLALLLLLRLRRRR
jgi:MYXO-CTERM domain-containing protein